MGEPRFAGATPPSTCNYSPWMIDSHTHLTDAAFDGDRPAVLERAGPIPRPSLAWQWAGGSTGGGARSVQFYWQAVRERTVQVIGKDAQPHERIETYRANLYRRLPPADWSPMVSLFAAPCRLLEGPLMKRLAEERHADLDRALALAPHRASEHADAYILPNAPWARRVSGSFANQLAAKTPSLAHAVVTPNTRGGYAVSLRGPRGGDFSAASFCRAFGGGGRREAGGIDHLETTQLDALLDALEHGIERPNRRA